MSKKVEFTINLNGNAISGVATLTDKVDGLSNAAERAQGLFAKIGNIGLRLHGIISTVEHVTGKLREFTEANKAQQEAETKLAQVMRNTMGASAAEVAGIKELASAQQKLGVIGDEVQLAGAQELGTYLSKADSLKKLMPVMNDMLAQQYGLNASQEQATQIASMMGKVMDGQVGALSRYGYKFDEAQEKLLKYGTEEQRVATLAEVIGQSVGGMNEALAATPEGTVQQVANKLGDIKERIGAIWVQLQAKLAPIIEVLIGLVDGLINVVQMGWPVWIAVAVGMLVAVTKVQHKLQATSLAALLSGGAFTTMGAMAQAACRGISTAIMSIPIIGWIAAIISLVIGVITTLWNKCEGFRGFLTGAWEAIKTVVSNIWGMVKPIIDKVIGGIKKAIQTVVGAIKSVVEWVKGVLAKIKNWFKETFGSIFDWVVDLWHKVLEKLAKPLNKLIEIWNKITGGSVAAFKVGYEKGASKVRENKGKNGSGALSLQGGDVGGPGLGGAANAQAAKGAEAAVTGGTRNTTVNINLGKMVENIIFNGSFEENAQALEQRVQEIMYRTLAMAATM